MNINHNIFDLEFLQRLDGFHKALESELPYVESVDSLINARNTYGVEGELVVEPLIDVLPKTQEELKDLKSTTIKNSLYKNLLYS